MTIEWATNNPALLIHRVNLATLHKMPQSKWMPTAQWCRDVLLSEHSTIEAVQLIIDGDFRADVVSHLVRSTVYHPRHYVGSFREDWTGKPRPREPGAIRRYMSLWNPKALIALGRDRLCYKAMKETRQAVEDIKIELCESGDILMQSIGWAMVPHCVYRNSCPFKKSCRFFDPLKYREKSISGRYDIYLEDIEASREVLDEST